MKKKGRPKKNPQDRYLCLATFVNRKSYNNVTALANKLNISRSSIIARAIEYYFDKKGGSK